MPRAKVIPLHHRVMAKKRALNDRLFAALQVAALLADNQRYRRAVEGRKRRRFRGHRS